MKYSGISAVGQNIFPKSQGFFISRCSKVAEVHHKPPSQITVVIAPTSEYLRDGHSLQR
jgi:hypothetical protein